jgi:hypothetical protein
MENMILTEFLVLHKSLIKHKTWSSDKKKCLEKLQEFLACQNNRIFIKSHRDSKTTRVHLKYQFTIFRVALKQNGNMSPVRGQMALMICMNRNKFTHYLEIFPIDANENDIFNVQNLYGESDSIYYINSVNNE